MNKAKGIGRCFALAAGLIIGSAASSGQTSNFVNFETAPVHPVSLSADGNMLAVCNLPDGRVELFDLSRGLPRRVGSVAVGIDPVTARFNANGELWILNHISDSISIVDPQRRVIVATLDAFDGPADVVFTAGGSRAFVSHAGANVVEIWDTATRASLGSVDIDGDRPEAMAVSADESEIYIAILESGNGSTIIAPTLTDLERTPPPSAADLPDAPNRGLNPAPNSNGAFEPAINPVIAPPPPRVPVIVRKQNGLWLDDNRADWTDYISGDKAHLTGRIPGWDVADHDLAIMKASNGSLRYVRGLMNICFDVAVNPVTGAVAMIGTDGINEVRFEPVLKSIFNRVKIAMIDATAATATVRDLNPHLDYQTRTLPKADRRQSAGDPRGIAWNSRGTRAYIVGMGSNNLFMIDQDGNRVGSAVTLPDGPAGLALDEARNRIYVLSRFASQLVTLSMDTLTVQHAVPLHDPTPALVRLGRKHFYDTVENSGLGQAACASCHIDGRFDRLAWDLGDPAGELLDLATRQFTITPSVTNSFHPMKGPMVTQTLVDIIGHEPFHWRADRDGIEAFNPTFPALQGRDEELTDEQMAEFKAFLASLTFPPNPFRHLDNSLPTSLSLFAERSLGRGQLRAGERLPPGNALSGLANFVSSTGGNCAKCHTFPTGLGPDAKFLSGRWQPINHGPNDERHIGMAAQERTGLLPFKIQQLRNLADKNGFDLESTSSRHGFGFFHDGRVDTLTRFIQDGFTEVTDDRETADLIAFMVSMTGSELPAGVDTDVNRPPGPPSRDVHAGAGLQATQSTSEPGFRLNFMIGQARRVGSRLEMIANGTFEGLQRSWLMQGVQFLSDRANEVHTLEEILADASPTAPVVFTLVPAGTGRRMALDRDGDTVFNQNELVAGSDPADPTITPETTTPRLHSISRLNDAVRLEWSGRLGSSYRVQARDEFAAENGWQNVGEAIVQSSNPIARDEPISPSANARFYRIVHEP